jgi:biotin synthase-like enzyme
LRRARLGNIGRTTGEDTTMTERQLDGAEAILAEARKTKETAERMANGQGPPGEADDIRVLAGMIHQVAEQVERLAGIVSGGSAPLADPRESDT